MRAHCLAIAFLIAAVSSTPLEALLEEYLESVDASKSDADYDVHYDQRQSGTENYRLNVDGVLIAVPGASDSNGGTLGLLATQYLSDFVAASGNLDEDDDDDDVGADADKEGGQSHETHADKPYVFEVHDIKKKPLDSDLVALWNFKNGGGAGATNSDDDTSHALPAAAKKIVRQQIRPKSSGGLKKRNKHKLRLSSIIEYMKRQQSH